MIKIWYVKLNEKPFNCGANYIKIITFITQYYKLIQLDIFGIAVLIIGKCRCKNKDFAVAAREKKSGHPIFPITYNSGYGPITQ